MVIGLRPLNVVPLCQPLVGSVVDVLMAYCTVWVPGLVGMVRAFTVILYAVLLCSVGTPLTVAPSPLATALAVTVPVGVIALVAPVTLRAGILVGSVMSLVLALYVVGVPVIGTVTSVLLVRTAVPRFKPGGRLGLLTAKSAGVIDEAYVPFASVYTMLAPLIA